MLPMIAAAGVQAASGIAQSLMAQNQAGIDRDDRRYYAENAHSVEVADLKRAGLNPILSGMGGSGASFQGASGSDPGAGMAAGISSSAQMLANIPNMMADLAIKDETAKKIAAERENTVKQGMVLDSDISLKAGDVEKLNAYKKLFPNMAEAELQKLISGNKLAVEQAKAASASASKIGQEYQNLEAGGGFTNPWFHDAHVAWKKLKGMLHLNLDPSQPVGRSNAKR